MAPTNSRQLLALTLPTVVVLLSYFWYKKRRIGTRSDPGEAVDSRCTASSQKKVLEVAEKAKEIVTPPKKVVRSLSGVESAPIDIISPRDTRAPPPIISDEDLDLEIEKIKSMKYGKKTWVSPSQVPLPNSPSPKMPSPVVTDAQQHEQKKKQNRNKNKKKNTNTMVQQEMEKVEDELATLNMSTDVQNEPSTNEREHKISTGSVRREERDSANHSPTDGMVASPSLSSISDNSEGSNDSGKGNSDAPTPPPPTTPEAAVSQAVAPDNATACVPNNPPPFIDYYEFAIPQGLVGRLIGRRGSSINQIRDRTNAILIVRPHPEDEKLKVCSVEGTETEIAAALKMVRDGFPAGGYPGLTLGGVYFTMCAEPPVQVVPDVLFLKLVEAIENDTILTCLVATNHLFLQQSLHPSHPGLSKLYECMNEFYSTTETPMLEVSSPMPDHMICAAISVDGVHRAAVLNTCEETQMSYVKLLDYGGYIRLPNSQLRQLRADFLMLPFQAAECFLAGIESVNEDGSWAAEAFQIVSELCHNFLLTQVVDYNEYGIPLVYIYVKRKNEPKLFLNQYLVELGLARWTYPVDAVEVYSEYSETIETVQGVEITEIAEDSEVVEAQC